MSKYLYLSNNHVRRERNLEQCVYYDGAFDSVELGNINRFMDQIEYDQASTVGEFYNGVTYEQKDLPRISRTRFVSPTDEFQWIFDRINNVVSHMNDRHYGFDLYGFDHLQLTEYHGNDGGKYEWHMDTMLGDVPDNIIHMRKLSAVLLLSEPGVDFEGGEFQINYGEEKYPMELEFKKGRMIIFPSFLIHRVTPVTRGIRRSMVTWIEGPKFR
jgi:PKHD-type hydroxylase